MTQTDLAKLLDWSIAPEWANFAVIDGRWNLWWFEDEPSPTVLSDWAGLVNSRSEKVNLNNRARTRILIKRPDTVDNIILAKQLVDNLLTSWNKLDPDLQEMFKLQCKDQLSELKKFIE